MPAVISTRLLRAAILAIVALTPVAIPVNAGAAPAPETKWRVSATITGRYANTVGWLGCTVSGPSALINEVADINVTMRPGRAATFSRATGLFVRFAPPKGNGGHWTLGGSYPPRVYSPTGEASCGAQVPVACSGPILTRGRYGAALDFGVRGTYAIGYFSSFWEIVESASYAAPDPALPFCSASGEEPSQVKPLFGLGGTSLAVRAAPIPDTFPARVPVAKLQGRKRFSVLLPPAVRDGCPTDFYNPCTESGQIRMKLTFTPVTS